MSIQLFEDAKKLDSEGKYLEAAIKYDQLLTQNHENPSLLCLMGSLLARDENTIGLSIVCLSLALKNWTSKYKNPPPAELYSNLGIAYRHSGQTDKALECYEKAVKLGPTAGTYTNYGNMFVENGDPLKAIPLLEKAVVMDPSMHLAHWNLALALLETGQWDRAWDEHEHGKFEGGARVLKKNVDLPDWDGTPGLKLIAYGEQGIGDEIMFASMLPDLLKTNEVILDCHPRLTTLFEKSFGVKCYGTRKDKEADWIEVEKPDAMVALGSLGKFYRRSKEAFPGTPYLKVDSAPRGEKFRVGISWTGGRSTQRVARRTVPLAWWGSVFSNDCEFVSLQYTEGCEKEIEICNKSLGTSITQHPAAKAEDYYELAKVVKSCDLIITVCTSLVHLAGALGVPTWVMVPRRPAWRYQNKGPMPWYKSVRLYRQPEHDESAWFPVVGRVGLDLADLLQMNQQKVA